MNPHRQLVLAAAAALAVAALAACSKTPTMAAVDASASSAAAVNVADVDVTEHVKTALLRSESLQGMDIMVTTTKGDVRLTGVLNSQTQIDDALRIARSVEGAHAIHHELTIKP